MPKVKWGTGADALTAADIDGARSSEFTPYAGPLPSAGVYRFVVKQVKQGTSGTGNPRLATILELDGSWKDSHKKYDGCPLFDQMPVMKSTAFRVKAFCEAFGISSREFSTAVLVDDDGKVTRLGSAGDPAGLEVYISIKRRPASGEYEEGIQLNGTGYLPVDDAPDDAADDDSDADAEDGEEPPF